MAPKKNPLETPMMKQFFEFKEQVKDAILFFRLGDFYEMFFDDAVIASEILGITLTSRHKDVDIPLAGIPWHSADNYIKKLLDAGKKVAVCEQIEKPDKKKKTVARKIVRILTPGTVVEENSLDESTSNFLLSVTTHRNNAGLVWVDVSCGDVYYCTVKASEVEDVVRTINPREIIATEQIEPLSISFVEKTDFDYWVPSQAAGEFIEKHGTAFYTNTLENAFHLMLFYLDRLYFGDFPPLRTPNRWGSEETVGLDYNTLANLEIERTLIGGNKTGSLIWAIDNTLTAIGKRHLRNLVKVPLCNKDFINARLDSIETLIEEVTLYEEIRNNLKNIKDIERTLSRILVKRGGPREIIALAASLCEALDLLKILYSNSDQLYFFKELLSNINLPGEKISSWENTFVEEPPANYKEGSFINKEYSSEIGELYEIIHNSRSLLLRLEKQEKEKTGIPTLKVGFTRVFGYYIEVSKRFGDKVPAHYVRKQTTANAERYFTDELKQLEEKILNAKEIMTEKELRILDQQVDMIAAVEDEIQKIARVIAWIDVFMSFARLAKDNHYERPEITEDDGIEIVDGRHPVVEAMLGPGKYVPASIAVGNHDSRMNIITGPNMGGKSTLMRKVALITLLAQIGSFVPARRARIGMVDAIFTRVGASDNVSRGESTFLVEMKETSAILKNATSKSLVILDEIGRGTGTYDGISLARSIAQYLVERIGAVTLFATHYHILTELSEDYTGVQNFHMAVKEFRGHIQFLYQLNEGGSSRSFGVEVARLADMPLDVIKNAETTLRQLEKADRKMRMDQGSSLQTDIFSLQSNAVAENYIPEWITELENIVKDHHPDNLTPKDAHNLLYTISSILHNHS